MLALLSAAMVLSVSLASAFGADHPRRVALVIGNAEYQFVPRLSNSTNDARLLAETLKQLDFELIGGGPQLNLDRSGMERAIREFGKRLGQGDVGLFFYSGHGLQIRGKNYLVPVSANPTNLADVDFELLDADTVLDQMSYSGTSLNLVILDACRNNPFGGRGLRDVGTGLAQMAVPQGTLISYATQPGGVAQDGEPGGNSPYTAALGRVLKTPGTDILRVFNLVGVEVSRATRGEQIPWVSSSPIDGEFFLAAPTPTPVAIVVPQPPGPPSAPAASLNREFLFWQGVLAGNTRADYEAYLHAFPNGQFAPLAHNRIAAIENAGKPAGGPSSWTADERRRARLALRVMGLINSPVSDAPLTDAERGAIEHYQEIVTARPLGGAAGGPIGSLPVLADRLTSLLVRGDMSPSGVRAVAVPRAGDRYARGWAADTRNGAAGRDGREAAYWYALAARLGDARAFTQLGLLILRGEDGNSADPAGAALLWWLAAIRGEATASYDIGLMHERGVGIPVSSELALRWYALAAEQGSRAAADAVKRLKR